MPQIVNIAIDQLYPHPDNPRKDLGDLTELADSIKESMQEEHFSGLEMAKLYSALIELKKYQEADEEGRLAVLPCKVGGSMLNTIDIERPRIMKRLHFAVAYESVRGIIFYIPYDIFREYIDAGHVQPLHKLKEVRNGKAL